MPSPIADVRRQLDRLRVALASPSHGEIRNALADLTAALKSLQELERALTPAQAKHIGFAKDTGFASDTGLAKDMGFARELAALAAEIGSTQRLADRGLELCGRWAVSLAAAAGGYLASGKSAPLSPAATIRIEG